MSELPLYPTEDQTRARQIYTYAAATAIERVNEHWARWDFNMWETYNTTLSNTWIDPWFEHELHGIDNSGPEYEQTQNIFYIVNWLKYKGYSDYAITALITSAIQSSTVTGGLWEDGVHPYAALEGFNANNRAGNNSRDWYTRAGIAPAWTTTAYDEYMHATVSATANAGSWAALRHSPIRMHDDVIQGVTYRRPVYPIEFDTSQVGTGALYEHDSVGYGLVQWSNFPVLISKADHTAQDGGRHWQLNLTLQLMVMEYERVQAMTAPSQIVPEYEGEWVNANAPSAFITINGIDYHYPYATCTWNDWRDDLPVEQFYNYMRDVRGIEISEWDKRHIMMDIYRVCYIHSGYHDFDFEQKSLYVWNAIHYWENTIGFDPKWIPRARDIPECELDYFHINPDTFITIAGRRRHNNARRTVFL